MPICKRNLKTCLHINVIYAIKIRFIKISKDNYVFLRIISDLYRYPSLSDIYEIDYNSHLFDDEEIEVLWWLANTFRFYVRVSLSFPQEIPAIVRRYNRERHWWEELCFSFSCIKNCNHKDTVRNI